MTTPCRIVPTPSILNLRDYGGYKIRTGGHVKWGHLFRSSDHSIASDEDLSVFEALGVAAIIDLRSLQERLIRPSRRHSQSRAEVLVPPSVEPSAAPHIAAIDGPSDPHGVRDRLIQYYRESPFRDAQRQGLRLYFEALERVNGPTLVHCAAGKDRTGIAVALLLVGLGVEMDQVRTDYLMTNDAGTFEERAHAFAYSVSHHFGRAPSDAVLRAALSVDPAYLDAMFEAVTAECGDVRRYLNAALGIDETRFRTIARRLLV